MSSHGAPPPSDSALPGFLPRCRELQYSKELPQISIIFIFVNEALSVILRSVHSAVNHTPTHLLKEIILVDDNSDEGTGQPACRGFRGGRWQHTSVGACHFHSNGSPGVSVSCPWGQIWGMGDALRQKSRPALVHYALSPTGLFRITGHECRLISPLHVT